MKRTEVDALRRQIKDKLATLPERSERLAYLGGLVDAAEGRGGDPGALVGAAFAKVYLVLEKFHKTSKDGTRWLHEAIATFTALAEDNRKLRGFEKELQTILGNFLWSVGAGDDAISAYKASLAHEDNPDQKARGQLNIARVHLGMGHFYKCLEIAEKIDLPKVEDIVLKDYVTLLRARAYLALGLDRDASESLATLRTRLDLPAPVALECRYLDTMANLAFDAPAGLMAAYDDFVNWVQEHRSESAYHFYLLEEMIFRMIIVPEQAGTPAAFKTRVKYLAGRAGDSKLMPLALAFAPILLPGGPTKTTIEPVLEALAALSSDGHQIFVRAVTLLAVQQLIQMRHYDKAARLIQAHKVYCGELELGIAPEVLAALTRKPSASRTHLEQLIMRLPEVTQANLRKIGSSLL
jgi:hypothetical protein